ncbi:MAG: hypothetical protein OXT67_06440 [Zetaproteobacteria bacterium]|nr:hypothetical protein [Zetaproteobacteria bacterium]
MRKFMTFVTVCSTLFLASAVFAGRAVSLEELQKTCNAHNSGGQLRPGEVQYVCTRVKTFWVEKTPKTVSLPNEKSICFSMDLKDKAFETSPVHKKYTMDAGVAECSDMVQMQASESLSRAGDCELVNEIVAAGGEEEFCKNLMVSSGHAAEFDKVVEEMKANPAKMAEIAATAPITSPVETGKKKICNIDCAGKKGDCEGPSSTDTSSSSSSSSSSDEQLSDADFYKNEMKITDYAPTESQGALAPENIAFIEATYGADLKEVTVQKRMDPRYEGVRVMTVPEAGKLLARTGVMKDDIILRVNGYHVRSIADLNVRLNDISKELVYPGKSVRIKIKVRRLVPDTHGKERARMTEKELINSFRKR